MCGRKRSGFTLVELLVVISIVVLLMAVLLPVVHKARKQAQAVTCQANLHQWAMLFQQYTCEYDGRFFRTAPGDADGAWYNVLKPRLKGAVRLHRCPSQTFLPNVGYSSPARSYGTNCWIDDNRDPPGSPKSADSGYWWRNAYTVRSPHATPVLLDCSFSVWCYPRPPDPPPGYEDALDAGAMGVYCVPRHGSFINSVFMDWSVRRVGLKELWTLKWHREYTTAGPWTKAGGVASADWPQWMRKFKDY